MLDGVSSISRTSALDRLTSNQEGEKIEFMKRTAKVLITFGLMLFFASALLCATLAAPGQILASITGCSQDNHVMEMTGCEHPSFVCDFNRSSHFLSQGVSSTPSNGSLKNTLGLTVGQACFDSSTYAGPFVVHEHTSAFPTGPRKVPIHLYNSVLTI